MPENCGCSGNMIFLSLELSFQEEMQKTLIIHRSCPSKKFIHPELRFGLSFSVKKEKNCMNTSKDKNKSAPQKTDQSVKEQKEKQRSSAFKESSRGDEKSTTNIEEEAGLEQERKEAMTERD